MQYNFGTGLLTLKPSGANPTPVQIGTLQQVSLDMEFTTKELRGQYAFPVEIARTSAKLAGKAKTGQFNGSLLLAFLAGGSIGTGQRRGTGNEPHSIPATPFEVTVTNAADFEADLGVYNVTTQTVMTRVASAPATGEYSVNESTGVYTFATADEADVVWISYEYSSTAGRTVSFTNQLMGSGTTFELTLFNEFRGKYFGYRLYSVQVPKLTLPAMNEDFTLPDIDFAGFADSSGRVLDLYTSE